MFESPLCSATNKFEYASIERCSRSTQAAFFFFLSCCFVHAFRVIQLCFIYTVLSMYKQCWLIVLFTPQLKHASHLVKAPSHLVKAPSHLVKAPSHLVKARFSGKAGSCFLKVRAASLIRPRKVTQSPLRS